MDNNSAKRRRLNESNFSPMPTSKGKGKAVDSTSSQNAWIPNQIPIEIFNLIIIYLPRSTIQNMRLVNHEFEAKVSQYLFKYVVVPFRPDIYGITSKSSTTQSSILLQDKGMLIFQGFGRYIKHFAMSFEIDIDKLTTPPVKDDHDTIKAFWGSYKWPFQKYNRYAQLEGLEQKADETRTMTKAFQFLEGAEELGLSIDGGLGWLAGPDLNEKVVQRGEKPVVFGSSRFEPEPKTEPNQRSVLQHYQPFRTELSPDIQSTIQRMLQEAGYRNDLLDQSFQGSRFNENSEGSRSGEGQVRPNVVTMRRIRPAFVYADFEVGIARTLGQHFRDGVEEDDDVDDEIFAEQDGVSSDDNDDDDNDDGDVVDRSRAERQHRYLEALSDPSAPIDERQRRFFAAFGNEPQVHIGRSKSRTHLLKPNELKAAQKEMLLELEWAQRAFMQTFTIAVIDSPASFVAVKKLTIARLPNTHLANLDRADFWNSLPNLDSISLGVIPDWRELNKLPTSWVQDNKVIPSKAVTTVFQLLSRQISQRQNIKSLHFEWISGGEYAPGLFTRNQHILAAPVVSAAINMVSRKPEKQVLQLPFIKDLSLKNCWFSPHIFEKFIGELKEHDLQCLTLDSISLSAFIRPGFHPTEPPLLHQNANAQTMALNMGIRNPVNVVGGLNLAPFIPVLGAPGPPIPALPVAATNSNAQSAWLNQPRIGSWADVIDKLTPGHTLADLRSAMDPFHEDEPRKQTSLRKLVFKSCGYARLPLEFDQSALNVGRFRRGLVPRHISARIHNYETMMMKSGDPLLASITNTMRELEVDTLENAWNMTLGWVLPDFCTPMPIDHQQMIEAQADGITRIGAGRFNGIIEVPAPAPVLESDMTVS